MCFGHLPQDMTAFYCGLSPPSRALEHGATQDFWTISKCLCAAMGDKNSWKIKRKRAVLIKTPGT